MKEELKDWLSLGLLLAVIGTVIILCGML